MKDRRAASEYRQKRHSCADKVDRVEDLDLDAISREDLIWQHGTGVSVSHGTGRAKTYTYRSGVQTQATWSFLCGPPPLGMWSNATGWRRRPGIFGNSLLSMDTELDGHREPGKGKSSVAVYPDFTRTLNG